MPGRTARKAYHHGDLRPELIRAAEDIIAREGTAGVTMRALSDMTGVSPAAPYRHFADKTAILCAVAEEGFRRLGERLVPIARNGSGDPLRQFRDMALTYVEFAVENPSHYRLMYGRDLVMYGRDLALESPPDELRQVARAAFGEALSMIVMCRDAGLIAPTADPLALTSILWSTIHGLSMLLIDGQIRTTESASGMHALLVENGTHATTDVRALTELAVDTILAGFRP